MYSLTNCDNIDSAISSLALEAGLGHSDLPDGQKTGPSGPVLAPASPSVQQANSVEQPTSATCGQPSQGSSASAALQRFLASRLRQSLDVNGSLEYSLTWKEWAMPSREPICALRASGRRTSDNGSTGWPTPLSTDGEKGRDSLEKSKARGAGNLNLPSTAALSGWPTPAAQEAGGTPEQFLARKEKAVANGHTLGVSLTSLSMVAQLTGWPTPKVATGDYQYSQGDKTKPVLNLSGVAKLALSGWATPAARDWKSNEASQEHHDARAAQTRGKPLSEQAHQVASGTTTPSCPAQTESKGALNPEFSRWLMGFPAAWLSCVDWVTLSSRRSRQNSSKPSRLLAA